MLIVIKSKSRLARYKEIKIRPTHHFCCSGSTAVALPSSRAHSLLHRKLLSNRYAQTFIWPGELRIQSKLGVFSVLMRRRPVTSLIWSRGQVIHEEQNLFVATIISPFRYLPCHRPHKSSSLQAIIAVGFCRCAGHLRKSRRGHNVSRGFSPITNFRVCFLFNVSNPLKLPLGA